MSRSVLPLSLLLVALAACAPARYRYAPVTITSAEVDGKPAVEAPIPDRDPRGSVRIVPLGITTVTPPNESGVRPFSACYVRLLVENRSTEAWTIDEAEQRLITKYRGEDFTSYATTSTGVRAPVVTAPPGTTFHIDLLFELPPGATKPDHVETFDVLWKVRAGARDVAGAAEFRRIPADPPSPNGSRETLPPPQRGPGRYGPRPQ